MQPPPKLDSNGSAIEEIAASLLECLFGADSQLNHRQQHVEIVSRPPRPYHGTIPVMVSREHLEIVFVWHATFEGTDTCSLTKSQPNFAQRFDMQLLIGGRNAIGVAKLSAVRCRIPKHARRPSDVLVLVDIIRINRQEGTVAGLAFITCHADG